MLLGVGHLPCGCRTMMMSLCCVLVLCVLPGWAVSYKQGDNVTLYVNKVGPYHNPQETYHYYTLPVCSPEKVSHVYFHIFAVILRSMMPRDVSDFLCSVHLSK